MLQLLMKAFANCGNKECKRHETKFTKNSKETLRYPNNSAKKSGLGGGKNITPICNRLYGIGSVRSFLSGAALFARGVVNNERPKCITFGTQTYLARSHFGRW